MLPVYSKHFDYGPIADDANHSVMLTIVIVMPRVVGDEMMVFDWRVGVASWINRMRTEVSGWVQSLIGIVVHPVRNQAEVDVGRPKFTVALRHLQFFLLLLMCYLKKGYAVLISDSE